MFKRAWLYITRKRGRSILLLVILCISAVFAMLGLAVKASADKQAETLRKSLCSSFDLSINEENDSLWVMEYGEQGQACKVYSGPRMTTDLTKRILEMDYITDYCASDTLSMWADLELRPGFNMHQYLEYKENPNEISDFEKSMGITPDYFEVKTQQPDFYGCTNTELYEAFRTGALSLSEGRHIKEDDRYKAVISAVLAERNNLSVGDTITAEAREGIYVFNGDVTKIIGEPLRLEIIGLFNINFEQEVSYLTPSDSEPYIFTFEHMFVDNIVFCDLYSVRQILVPIYEFIQQPPDAIQTVNEATFFVDDPKNLDSAISQVQSLEEIKPEYFTIQPDDAAYRASAKPLKNLGTFSTVLIVIVLLCCFVLLYLTLNVWIKNRKREMGVLLSLGIKKQTIIFQLLLESLFISFGALILAVCISGLLADSFGHVSEAIMTPKQMTAENYTVERNIYFEPVIENVSTDPVDLEYGLTVQNILIVAAVIIGSTVLSVLITARNVLRLKPKYVLSSM